MTGRSSHRKGSRAELELAGHLNDMLGVTVRRKLGAGRQDDAGDLDGLECCAQVKNYTDFTRAVSDGLRDLEQQTLNSGHDWGVVFARRRGGQWVGVMPLDHWVHVYREAIRPHATNCELESEVERLRGENGLLRSTLRDIELRAQYAHETTARKEP